MKRTRYQNLNQVQMNNSWKNLLLWYKERMKKQKDLSFQIPHVEQPNMSYLNQNRNEPTITWVGHCTFLIQLKGINIITDPVWANHLFTYKRLSPPGLPLHEMPPIDIVLISHSHYDHLHARTIKKLPGNPLYLVPVGLGKWFLRRGIQHVAEFNWWGTWKQKVWNLPLFQHNIGQSVPIRHEYLSLGWLGDRRKKQSIYLFFRR